MSETDVHANIRELLTVAVRKRLMAERRIGCFLSGGLDSSLISALLLKLGNEVGLPYKIQVSGNLLWTDLNIQKVTFKYNPSQSIDPCIMNCFMK